MGCDQAAAIRGLVEPEGLKPIVCFAAESLFITKNKTERNFYIQKGERILLTNF